MPPRKSDEVRCLLIDSIASNQLSIVDAARTYGYKYRAAAAIYRLYLETGQRIELKRGGGKVKLLNPEVIASIQEWISDDCTTTLLEIQRRIVNDYGIDPCISTIQLIKPLYLFI